MLLCKRVRLPCESSMETGFVKFTKHAAVAAVRTSCWHCHDVEGVKQEK
jgi:hypothetical protein